MTTAERTHLIEVLFNILSETPKTLQNEKFLTMVSYKLSNLIAQL